MIRLTLSPTVHRGPNQNEIPVNVVCSNGRQAASRVPIVFYLDGAEWVTRETDHQGRINLVVPNIPDGGGRGDGKVIIEVVRSGTTESDRKQALIPMPMEREPKLYSVSLQASSPSVVGDTLVYKVHITTKGRLPNSTTDVAMPDILGHWVCSGRSGDVTTGADGNAWFDLTLSESGQHKLIFAAQAHSQQLELEGPQKKEKPKIELKLGVEGDSLKARRFIAVVPLELVDSNGKGYPENVEVFVTEGGAVEFRNAETDAVLAQEADRCELTTNINGLYRLRVKFLRRDQITLKFVYKTGKQERTLRLVYTQ